jgi:hypothetical protein
MKKSKLKIGEKGVDPITTLAAVLITSGLILGAFYITNLIVETNVVRRIARETAALQVIDAMDFLKRSMQEAVKHAAYKASYDVLDRGGYYSIPDDVSSLDCRPYWRKYSETIEYDNEIFEQSLEAALADVFECYGKVYSIEYSKEGISTSTPYYSVCGSVDVTDDDRKFSINIKNDCDAGLEVSGNFISVKESNANFEGEATLNAFELIEKAKTKFVENRPVLGAVQSAISDMDCKSLTAEELECSYTGMEYDQAGEILMNAKCSNWKTKMKNLIDEELAKTEISGAEASFSFSNENLNADYTVTGCTLCEAFEEESDECVEESEESEPTYGCDQDSDCCEGLEGIRVVCMNNVCDLATPGAGYLCPEEPEEQECTKKIITKYSTSCSYEYDADVNVVVTVTAEEDSEDAYYPIYNSNSGDAEWQRLALRFRVLDGTLEALDVENVCSEINYC